MTYEALLSELELQQERIIVHPEDGSSHSFRQLPFVFIRLEEPDIVQCKYKDKGAAQVGAARFKKVRTALNTLCKKVEENPGSMNLVASFGSTDKRIYLLHLIIDEEERELLFVSYHSLCSATMDYENDLAFLKDILIYVQKKCDLYSYNLKAIHIFGSVYYAKPIPQKEEAQEGTTENNP